MTNVFRRIKYCRTVTTYLWSDADWGGCSDKRFSSALAQGAHTVAEMQLIFNCLYFKLLCNCSSSPCHIHCLCCTHTQTLLATSIVSSDKWWRNTLLKYYISGLTYKFLKCFPPPPVWYFSSNVLSGSGNSEKCLGGIMKSP